MSKHIKKLFNLFNGGEKWREEEPEMIKIEKKDIPGRPRKRNSKKHKQWRKASQRYYDKNRDKILKRAHDKLIHDKQLEELKKGGRIR